MKRERSVRLFVALALCAAAGLSVALLHTGRADLLLRLLRASCRAPNAPLRAFGRFHITALSLCGLAVIGAALLAWRGCDDRMLDRIVFAAGCSFFVMEWYKQLFSFYVTGNGQYDFSVLPFQFCSLPMYLSLAAPLLGNRAKKTVYSFLSLFGTVGGYLVMIYPNLPDTLTMSVYTMLWHTLMVALGVLLLLGDRRDRAFLRDYLPAAGLFLTFFAVALVLNIALYPIATEQGSVLNLYYMSPYYETTFLIVKDAARLYGWGASVLTYLLLFLSAGAFPLWCVGAITAGSRKKRKKK